MPALGGQGRLLSVHPNVSNRPRCLGSDPTFSPALQVGPPASFSCPVGILPVNELTQCWACKVMGTRLHQLSCLCISIYPAFTVCVHRQACTWMPTHLCVYLQVGHAHGSKSSQPPPARPSPMQTQCPRTPLQSWHGPHHAPPPPAHLVGEWIFHLS